MTDTDTDTKTASPGALPSSGLPCPRCGGDIAGEAYYGPCTACRDALRAAFAGEARDVEVVAYEPKMNVTPNAVALKDD